MANNPAAFLIGGNDEHGTDSPAFGKRTPVLPYINRSFYENEFNRAAKIRFLTACLRIGFDVYDVKPEMSDTPIAARVSRINSRYLSRLVTFGYNAYGSGSVFTDVAGFVVAYSDRNPHSESGKTYCEDIAFSLSSNAGLKLNSLQDLDIGVLSSVNCVSALVEAGFMTDYKEAARMLCPDFQRETAEAVARATCLNLDVRYVERDDLNAYRTLKEGDYGNAVRLLQYLLITDGFNLQADGIFGRSTEAALTDFQTLNSLVPDGTATAAVYRRLLLLDRPDSLARGDTSSYVLELQRRLLCRLYPVETDGIFGERTENAVREFQREHGLPDTGIADPSTLDALKSAAPRPRLY